MNKLLRTTAAFAVAVVLTATIASICSTQFVVAELQELGVIIPIDVRVSMTISDLSILQTLALVVVACFLIGFLLAGFAHRSLGGNRQLWYLVAGGCALISALLLISAVLQLMPIAGARTTLGLFTQFLAGAAGGLVFAKLTTPKQRRSRYA